MKSERTLKVCGSITKKESLARIKNITLEHTYVAEANLPYANYYGRVPETLQPNSLFLFTDRCYTLEEALRFTQNIDICERNKVNTASAQIQFKTHRYPAIRIRNFPDYEHLKMLQECFLKLGMKFARKISMEPEAVVTVNKCFTLEKKEEGIYFDKELPNEGYITVDKRLDYESFDRLMHDVWNNGNCKIFDGAMGGFLIDNHVTDMIRVYSEHIDVKLLKCIKKEVDKQIQSY
jgi:hypothetical protein